MVLAAEEAVVRTQDDPQDALHLPDDAGADLRILRILDCCTPEQGCETADEGCRTDAAIVDGTSKLRNGGWKW